MSSNTSDNQTCKSVALGCGEARTAFSLPGECCDSCHDDFDQGYEQPIECEDADGRIWARVCCAVVRDLESAGVAING